MSYLPLGTRMDESSGDSFSAAWVAGEVDCSEIRDPRKRELIAPDVDALEHHQWEVRTDA